MHKIVPRAASARTLLAFSIAAALAGCTGEDPVAGRWRQTDATTTLPAELGGGELGVDATLTFDASEGTFDVHLDLAFEGLSDVVDAHGTYERTATELTLTFTGFTIDPASGNTAAVAEDGSQCITLMGFGGATVCFPAPQTNEWALEGETLTLTIDQAIAPAGVTQTTLALTRVEE